MPSNTTNNNAAAATVRKPQRISFASSNLRMDYPDFLEVQLKSFKDFFQLETTAENRLDEGLYKVFMENFPITDTRNNFVLEFIDYYIDPPRYSIDECLERGLTYSVPLKAKLKLYCTDPEHEDFDPVIQDVYFGAVPYMTPRGRSSSTALSASSCRSCIVRPACSSARACTRTARNCTAPVSSRSKVRGSNSPRTSTT